MRQQNTRLAVITTLTVLAGTPVVGTGNTAAAAQVKPTPRRAPSKSVPAATRTLQVASVPAGLSVYIARASEPALVSAKSVGQVMLTNAKYLKGATPVSVSGLKQGTYVVGVAPMRGTPERPDLAFVCKDPSLKNKEYLVVSHPETISTIVSAPGAEPLNGASTVIAAFYEIEVGDVDAVVILAVPSTASVDELERLYPAGDNYAFDKEAVVTMLSGEFKVNTGAVAISGSGTNVDAETLERQFALLRRGGKIVMRMPFKGLAPDEKGSVGLRKLEMRTVVDCSKPERCVVSRSVGLPD